MITRDFFFIIPAFSNAIFLILLPRKFIWSIEIGVITLQRVFFITFVASNLPPKPVSNRIISALFLLNARKADAVVISKKVIGSELFFFSHSSNKEFKYLFSIKFELILILSLNLIK